MYENAAISTLLMSAYGQLMKNAQYRLSVQGRHTRTGPIDRPRVAQPVSLFPNVSVRKSCPGSRSLRATKGLADVCAHVKRSEPVPCKPAAQRLCLILARSSSCKASTSDPVCLGMRQRAKANDTLVIWTHPPRVKQDKFVEIPAARCLEWSDITTCFSSRCPSSSRPSAPGQPWTFHPAFINIKPAGKEPSG